MDLKNNVFGGKKIYLVAVSFLKGHFLFEMPTEVYLDEMTRCLEFVLKYSSKKKVSMERGKEMKQTWQNIGSCSN